MLCEEASSRQMQRRTKTRESWRMKTIFTASTAGFFSNGGQDCAIGQSDATALELREPDLSLSRVE